MVSGVLVSPSRPNKGARKRETGREGERKGGRNVDTQGDRGGGRREKEIWGDKKGGGEENERERAVVINPLLLVGSTTAQDIDQSKKTKKN